MIPGTTYDTYLEEEGTTLDVSSVELTDEHLLELKEWLSDSRTSSLTTLILEKNSFSSEALEDFLNWLPDRFRKPVFLPFCKNQIVHVQLTSKQSSDYKEQLNQLEQRFEREARERQEKLAEKEERQKIEAFRKARADADPDRAERECFEQIKALEGFEGSENSLSSKQSHILKSIGKEEYARSFGKFRSVAMHAENNGESYSASENVEVASALLKASNNNNNDSNPLEQSYVIQVPDNLTKEQKLQTLHRLHAEYQLKALSKKLTEIRQNLLFFHAPLSNMLGSRLASVKNNLKQLTKEIDACELEISDANELAKLREKYYDYIQKAKTILSNHSIKVVQQAAADFADWFNSKEQRSELSTCHTAADILWTYDDYLYRHYVDVPHIFSEGEGLTIIPFSKQQILNFYQENPLQAHQLISYFNEHRQEIEAWYLEEGHLQYQPNLLQKKQETFESALSEFLLKNAEDPTRAFNADVGRVKTLLPYELFEAIEFFFKERSHKTLGQSTTAAIDAILNIAQQRFILSDAQIQTLEDKELLSKGYTHREWQYSMLYALMLSFFQIVQQQTTTPKEQAALDLLKRRFIKILGEIEKSELPLKEAIQEFLAIPHDQPEVTSEEENLGIVIWKEEEAEASASTREDRLSRFSRVMSSNLPRGISFSTLKPADSSENSVELAKESESPLKFLGFKEASKAEEKHAEQTKLAYSAVSDQPRRIGSDTDFAFISPRQVFLSLATRFNKEASNFLNDIREQVPEYQDKSISIATNEAMGRAIGLIQETFIEAFDKLGIHDTPTQLSIIKTYIEKELSRFAEKYQGGEHAFAVQLYCDKVKNNLLYNLERLCNLEPNKNLSLKQILEKLDKAGPSERRYLSGDESKEEAKEQELLQKNAVSIDRVLYHRKPIQLLDFPLEFPLTRQHFPYIEALLSENPQITKLDLRNNQFSSRDVERIIILIRKHPHLLEVNLGNNSHITSEQRQRIVGLLDRHLGETIKFLNEKTKSGETLTELEKNVLIQATAKKQNKASLNEIKGYLEEAKATFKQQWLPLRKAYSLARLETLINKIDIELKNPASCFNNNLEYVREAEAILQGKSKTEFHDKVNGSSSALPDYIVYQTAKLNSMRLGMGRSLEYYNYTKDIERFSRYENASPGGQRLADLKNLSSVFNLYKDSDEQLANVRAREAALSKATFENASSCFLQDLTQRNVLDLSNQHFNDIDLEDVKTYLLKNPQIQEVKFSKNISDKQATAALDILSGCDQLFHLNFINHPNVKVSTRQRAEAFAIQNLHGAMKQPEITKVVFGRYREKLQLLEMKQKFEEIEKVLAKQWHWPWKKKTTLQPLIQEMDQMIYGGEKIAKRRSLLRAAATLLDKSNNKKLKSSLQQWWRVSEQVTSVLHTPLDKAPSVVAWIYYDYLRTQKKIPEFTSYEACQQFYSDPKNSVAAENLYEDFEKNREAFEAGYPSYPDEKSYHERWKEAFSKEIVQAIRSEVNKENEEDKVEGLSRIFNAESNPIYKKLNEALFPHAMLKLVHQSHRFMSATHKKTSDILLTRELDRIRYINFIKNFFFEETFDTETQKTKEGKQNIFNAIFKELRASQTEEDYLELLRKMYPDISVEVSFNTEQQIKYYQENCKKDLIAMLIQPLYNQAELLLTVNEVVAANYSIQISVASLNSLVVTGNLSAFERAQQLSAIQSDNLDTSLAEQEKLRLAGMLSSNAVDIEEPSDMSTADDVLHQHGLLPYPSRWERMMNRLFPLPLPTQEEAKASSAPVQPLSLNIEQKPAENNLYPNNLYNEEENRSSRSLSSHGSFSNVQRLDDTPPVAVSKAEPHATTTTQESRSFSVDDLRLKKKWKPSSYSNIMATVQEKEIDPSRPIKRNTSSTYQVTTKGSGSPISSAITFLKSQNNNNNNNVSLGNSGGEEPLRKRCLSF